MLQRIQKKNPTNKIPSSGFLISISGIAQINKKTGIGVWLKIDSTKGYALTAINGVVADGPAQKIGLQEGDLILEVEGQSTRDLELKKVVDMIGGQEGSTVKLLIERNGTERTYIIQRLKFQYSASLYKTAQKEDAFCVALTTLMNDAGLDFKNTIGTKHDGDDRFDCKVNLPDAEKVYMENSWGAVNCYINLGTYKTLAEVNTAGTPLIAKIKACFPDYYFNPVVDKKGGVLIEIGKEYKDGFESPIMRFYFIFVDSLQNYQLILDINGGKATRYFSITTTPLDNSFSNSVRTIFNDIKNKYKNVKGTKHETAKDPNSLFGSATVWYDIVPLPDGAHDCTLSERGGIQLDMTNGCVCRFFQAANYGNAKATYTKVFQALFEGLGTG